MGELDRIVADLRLWTRQQRQNGVERVVFDHDFKLPEGEISTPADLTATTEVPQYGADGQSVQTPQEEESVSTTGKAAAKLGKGITTGEILERHPTWEGTELLSFAHEIDACRACGLAAGRNCSVPGTGNPRAKLLFVGEAPGAEEDRQGIPFVGRAGQLLDKILAAIELKREDVHILNILKCRPPENRNPAPVEIEACRPFLERQIDEIKPGILVALGLFSAQWLTGQKMSLTKLRETGPYEYRGIPVYATYHPAALLRNPNWKRPAWEDFKVIRGEYEKL
ncbi:MAG: uracil-DNA glycosylase [bacterium]|nr:uracil-DNA glycosylase [bacterium]